MLLNLISFEIILRGASIILERCKRKWKVEKQKYMLNSGLMFLLQSFLSWFRICDIFCCQGNYVASIICILDDTFMKNQHYEIFINDATKNGELLVIVK